MIAELKSQASATLESDEPCGLRPDSWSGRARKSYMGSAAQLDDKARVLEEWFRLPESRRSHPTDAVAFAYRLLRDRPDMFGDMEANQDMIVKWLLPYLVKLQA